MEEAGAAAIEQRALMGTINRIAVCLLAGLLTTLALVALAGLLQHRTPGKVFSKRDTPPWWHESPADVSWAGCSVTWSPGWQSAHMFAKMTDPDGEVYWGASYSAVAAGFPLPCFEGSGRSNGRFAEQVTTNQRGFSVPLLGYATYPTKPIFSGLVANTVFFAIVWWLLLAAGFALRRRHRRLRGRCVACGYTLAGLSICPECGVAASPRVLPA